MIRVGKAIIEVIEGDITEQDTVAIVNAANDYLWMGSGVAGAIKRKGGQKIETEAIVQGPIPIGEAVVTSGGNLKAKYVIHAAGMGQDLKTDAEKVRAACRNALLRAEERNIESVSFPAIGTGVGGLSPRLCAEAMIDTTIAYLINTKSIRRVVFVLFNQDLKETFHEYLLSKFSKK